MRNFILRLILFGLVLTNCSDDDVTINPLDDLRLLGKWEINGKGINNIASLETLCCESINYSDDSNTNDLRGTYIFNDISGNVTNGVFTVNTENNIIVYTTENDNTNSLEFSINNNIIEVWYFDEENNRNWTSYSKVINN